MLKSVHMITGENPNTDPTERSNSPDVINSVMARAIKPSSTVKVSALLMLVSDKNAGLMEVKTASINTSRISGPNSGIATNNRTIPGALGSEVDESGESFKVSASLENLGKAARGDHCPRAARTGTKG